MNKPTYFSIILAAVFTISFSDFSLAQCNVTGSTPDGGEVVVCSGADNNGLDTTDQADEVTILKGAEITRVGDEVIKTEDGDDKVQMNGGTITADNSNNDECIDLGGGNNEFHMTGGALLNCSRGLDMVSDGDTTNIIKIEDGVIEAINDEGISGSSGAMDEVYISGGELSSGGGVVKTLGREDKVIVTGGRLTQINDDDDCIDSGEEDDLISVSNATIDGTLTTRAINANDGDDTVRLGTGAEVLGLIDGEADFDTLVFEMAVPVRFIDDICAELETKDPAQGQITISGLKYEWEDFEVILCELVTSDPRPIPTLSQWGLIATAGVLGLVGLYAVRRRRAAA